ncbi:MAG: DUF4143 domain-containing protein [Streptococcaceae bacterium]|jgi:predicted AAA+ superfamily ATPase|nr:DUF4143 domain-containing protein [Streptococcaceae bacterium]
MPYKIRLIDETIQQYLKSFPAFLLIGAKGVGKTRSCQEFAKTSFELDNRSVREGLELLPTHLNTASAPILLDEWQFSPELWNYVRHAVDDGLKEGTIIFTGSSPKIDMPIHSGAGRIPILKMRPFSLEERQLTTKKASLSQMFELVNNFKCEEKIDVQAEQYLDEIFRSGFPGIRDKKEMARDIQLEDYIQNMLTHDFVEQGYPIRKPQSVLAWWRTYAGAIATVTSFQTILTTAMATNVEAPSKGTANSYRDALEAFNMIEEVPAWLPMGKLMANIARTPKHFLVDPAFAIKLLGISKEQLINYQPPKSLGKINVSFIGRLFESLVYQSLSVYSDLNRAQLSHFRTNTGKEIDFIVQKGNILLLFEVKSATTINQEDTKHLNWFETQVRDEYQVVKNLIYSGQVAYKRSDGINVIPAAMLAK